MTQVLTRPGAPGERTNLVTLRIRQARRRTTFRTSALA